MQWIEQARILLRKARQDAVIVSRAVEDAEIADEIVGFHAQQACEKCMKAVLSAQGIPYRRTHDLQELYDLLSDNAVPMPGELQELVAWSPFAVAYRYEDWQDMESVDRQRAEYLVQTVIAWSDSEVEKTVDDADGAPPGSC